AKTAAGTSGRTGSLQDEKGERKTGKKREEMENERRKKRDGADDDKENEE
ncbi:hypothetical protein TGRUB_429760, partial [Toxoplasma gondii RUB]